MNISQFLMIRSNMSNYQPLSRILFHVYTPFSVELVKIPNAVKFVVWAELNLLTCAKSMKMSETRMTQKLSTQHATKLNAPVYMTETELSLRWNLSAKKLQSDRCNGKGVRYLKLSHAVRYALADVEAFEASHTVGSTSEVPNV